MPVAPAMSRSLAILVSAAMLISFIAESEIVCAGVCAGGAVCAAGAGAAGGSGGGAVATPPSDLGGLLSSSTVRPVLPPCVLTPATPGHQTTNQTHVRAAPVRPA